MSRSLLIALAVVFGASIASGDARAQRDVQVAQATSQLSRTAAEGTGRSINRLASLKASAKRAELSLAQGRKAYEKELAEIDRLKRSRASWRRDRKLREQKAKSQKTAIALQEKERELRGLRNAISTGKSQLGTYIDRELNTAPSESRKAHLLRLLASVRRTSKPTPKRISIPDLSLDTFADPEELLEQIKLIEDAENRLSSEEKRLARKERHYAQMDALRSKSQRADDISALDNNGARRSTGTTASRDKATRHEGGADSAEADQPGAGDPSPPNEGAPLSDDFGAGDEGAGFEVSSVVLAEVIDVGTQTALRRAQRSTSPKTKAGAAKLAKDQVRARLSRLRASKEAIRRHLKKLQSE